MRPLLKSSIAVPCPPAPSKRKFNSREPVLRAPRDNEDLWIQHGGGPPGPMKL